MLSVILYGRHDDHGYNYHKRLSISLNCIAEVLAHPSDEIVFVDYNTPDELPTIIEAIQDILTPKAKGMLRILRVRPSQHARFRKQTILPLLEPVARNVAVRRTRPENRWILSTNIDMVFVPQKMKSSLTDVVSSLKDGFYVLPRMELPENFWELFFDRLNPEKNISFLRENSSKLHLDTIVRKENFIKYDNPGDFQLMLRKDIFEVGGFDEQMLKGWHVDSNLSKRMFLLGKIGPSIEHEIKCYHCNHTHKESFLHSQARTQNDWNRFVKSDTISPILSQVGWGLEDEVIEEISLKGSKSHLTSLTSTLEHMPTKNYDFLVHLGSYNQLTYNCCRIFTYLADHLCNLPADANIAYIGCNETVVQLIRTYLEHKKHRGKILCLKELGAFSSVVPSSSDAISQAFLLIFDFGIDENSGWSYLEGRAQIKKVMKQFFKLVKIPIKPSTKWIGIHVNHTDFNLIFSRHLSVRLNSYITGISYGYRLAKKPVISSSRKKRAILTLRYWVARYLFDYSDLLRSLILRTKLANTISEK